MARARRALGALASAGKRTKEQKRAKGPSSRLKVLAFEDLGGGRIRVHRPDSSTVELESDGTLVGDEVLRVLHDPDQPTASAESGSSSDEDLLPRPGESADDYVQRTAGKGFVIGWRFLQKLSGGSR